MDSKDPVSTRLPVDGSVMDNRDVVDMNATVDICPVAPDGIDSRAVVAMVGLDTVRRREEALMDCDGECEEWDIRKEFETVDLSGSLVEADMVASETAVDILTEGHDVSRVAESPIHWTSGVTDGDGVAFYYEGDLSDSDCGSAGDRERDTLDDWCDSAFRNGYGGFPTDDVDPQPPVVFSNQPFWDDDIAEPSQMLPDGGNAPVSTSPVLVGTIMPLRLPDMDRTSDWRVFGVFPGDW